jgi:hypothetical protein
MSSIAELESHIEQLQENVERRDLALKLEKNPDFRKLILDGFCVTECARSAQLSCDPRLKEVERADALGLAQAAGHLRRFLSALVRAGNMAEDQIKEAQEQLIEMQHEATRLPEGA